LERRQLRHICFAASAKRSAADARIHTDRKQLDGAAIAFVVIILLAIVALEIPLSRLNAIF